MKTRTLYTALLALFAAGACSMEEELEVRTFQLEHMQPHEAQPLIDPYVFADREGAQGMVSAVEGAISVRETRDNLDRIARVLEEFDRPRDDVRLHFQLIEANGYADVAPAIAEVETELRKIFQFDGYRLAGEGVVSASDRSEIVQVLGGPDGGYFLTGRLYFLQTDVIRLEEINLNANGPDGATMRTTVNIRPGQTLVLGSSPRLGAGADRGTLMLTVRAEVVPRPGE